MTGFSLTTFENPYLLYFPVDCQWSEWSKSGECTKSCGGGTQHFQRKILVQPRSGGQTCTGNFIKQEKCNVLGCPRNGKPKKSK